MKLKNIKLKIKKDYIFLTMFLFIIILTGFVFVRYFVVEKIITDSIDSDIKPSYLLQEIPEMDTLEVILDNPKFKELIYQEEFFTPVVVEKKGRPNPFMPFMEELGQEELGQEELGQEELGQEELGQEELGE